MFKQMNIGQKWLCLGVCALVLWQVAWPLYMVWHNESILRTGHPVWLEASLQDPYDIMRGEYIALKLAISQDVQIEQAVPRVKTDSPTRCDNANALDPRGYFRNCTRCDQTSTKQQRLFISLRTNNWGLATIAQVSAQEMATLHLRAKVMATEPSTLDYGLQKLFLPKQMGCRLENRLRAETNAHFYVEAYINRKGQALLSGRYQCQDKFAVNK